VLAAGVHNATARSCATRFLCARVNCWAAWSDVLKGYLGNDTLLGGGGKSGVVESGPPSRTDGRTIKSGFREI
jgi:hypothetical protein